MQQIGQIVLPVFGSLAFFLGDHLIAVPLNLARFASRQKGSSWPVSQTQFLRNGILRNDHWRSYPTG
jgi:hypothetical protein